MVLDDLCEEPSLFLEGFFTVADDFSTLAPFTGDKLVEELFFERLAMLSWVELLAYDVEAELDQLRALYVTWTACSLEGWNLLVAIVVLGFDCLSVRVGKQSDRI